MRRYFLLLISITILLATTVPGIISGNFAFVFDMGRDLLWTRNMVELKKPTLIGPWGSIAGVYFGPYWYYLLTIPYILFKGDPRGAITIPLISNVAIAIIGWWYLRREKHPLAANVFALFFATSPMIANLSSFAFHANLLPLAVLFFLIGLINRKLPLSALAASLTYSLEPAAAVMMTGYLLLIIFGRTLIFCKSKKSAGTPEPRTCALATHRRRPWEQASVVLGLFLIPFIPQLIFEFRHQFIQTKSLVAYFTGQNTSLGGNLPFFQRIFERIDKFSGILAYSIFPVDTNWIKWILMIVFIFSAIIFIKTSPVIARSLRLPMPRQAGLGMTSKADSIYRFVCYSLVFILFHYLAYVFIFPAELKGWYLSGFAFIYIFIFSIFVENAIRKTSKSNSLLIYFGLFLIAFHNLNPIQRLFRRSEQSPAPETFKAQLEVVNWIYQDALPTKQPFAVYTYTPPVYDYNFQYILWWQGTRKYHILPAEFSYLPNETTYLPEKQRFISSEWIPSEAKIQYLILEPDPIAKQQKGWLGHFAKYPIVSSKIFNSGLIVEIRSGI